MGKVQPPVILTYHSISGGKSALHTSPSVFAGQMRWLRSNAQVITLRRLVDIMTDRQPLPERAVVLTFDDGYCDFAAAAAPVLQRLQLPAIVSLSTAYCGGGRGRPEFSGAAIKLPTLDWQQIRELHDKGFELGAHAISHRALTEMSPEAAEQEIAGSKTDIEDHTGEPVGFFAYPYGQVTSALRQVVRKHYAAACSTAAGVVDDNADLFALPRVDACYLRHPVIFRSLFTDPFMAYLGARRIIRRIRGKPEGYHLRANERREH